MIEIIKRNNETDYLRYAEGNDILRFIINNGMIDISDVQDSMEAMKREELLKRHPYKIWQGKEGKWYTYLRETGTLVCWATPYKIWQGKEGKWYTYLPDEKKGRVQRERNTQREIENLVIRYWKTQEENPKITEVFEEWNDRRLELKKISDATYLRNRQIFDRHYGEFGGRRIRSVSMERGLLKRAKKRKLIDFNVEELFQDLDTSETDFKKVIKEDYEEVFSEEEMPRMISYLKENLDAKNIGILLMFATGIRVGELVALKHEVFDGNTFKIRRTETRYMGEGGKYVYDVKEFPKSEAGVRTVIIPEDYTWLCSKIKMLNPFGEYIFTDKDGKRMTTNCIRRRQERNCRKLGIYRKSPHKIRKTYGTILLDHNVDNRLIMEQMGHTDIACTENHYHRNRRSIDAKSQIISSIPEFQAK